MDRISRLLELTNLSTDEAVIVHKPSNIFYLSAFTGEGMLFLCREFSAIITDFRYTEQADRQSPGFLILETNKDKAHIAVAAELLNRQGIRLAYYEDDFVAVKQLAAMRDASPAVQFSSLDNQPEKLRSIKDEKELKVMARACAISVEAFDFVCAIIAEGMTEKDIRLKLDFRMLELGAQDLAFSSIVASGENGSLPHAVPGDRRIKKGDMITLDFGAKYGGYCADMTRTVAVGNPSSQMKDVYDIVLHAQMACQDALAPGKMCRDIDAIARKMIGDKGFGGNFEHGLGHSVGIDIHETPNLNQSCDAILAKGHVVTVEPGIYIPGIGGVRIENTCVITQHGTQSLVKAPRELLIL